MSNAKPTRTMPSSSLAWPPCGNSRASTYLRPSIVSSARWSSTAKHSMAASTKPRTPFVPGLPFAHGLYLREAQAHSTRIVRASGLPRLVMRPLRSVSPDLILPRQSEIGGDLATILKASRIVDAGDEDLCVAGSHAGNGHQSLDAFIVSADRFEFLHYTSTMALRSTPAIRRGTPDASESTLFANRSRTAVPMSFGKANSTSN